MFKYLTVAYAFFLMTPTLYADGDFCVADQPCDGETQEITSLLYPSVHYDYDLEAEELDSVTGWPGMQRDPFMDALSR